MNEKNSVATISASASVSPYLLRPLRSYEQALADIAAAKRRANTVTAFVPVASVENEKTSEAKNKKSNIAA